MISPERVQHHQSASEREKAEIEAVVWGDLDEVTRASHRRKSYLKRCFPYETIQRIDARFQLFSAGVAALPIWDRIADEGMPLTTAISRLSAATELVKERGMPLIEAITVALSEYDQWPWSHTIAGQRFRKKPAPPGSSRGTERKKSGRDSAIFWQDLRKRITSFYERKLNAAGLDPTVSTKLANDLCIDLQTACTEHAHRLVRARAEAKNIVQLDEALTISSVREACTILAVDPPAEFGDPVDLARASKNKKYLARQYHTDSAGTTANTELFDKVIGAYKTLKTYMESTHAPQRQQEEQD